MQFLNEIFFYKTYNLKNIYLFTLYNSNYYIYH